MSEVSDGKSLLNKQQRKKARRKQKKRDERQAHRNLDVVTGEAIAAGLRLAPLVADATSPSDRTQAIDVELASLSEAQFVRKRVNDALAVGEWLTEVRVVIWEQHEGGQALSASGIKAGLELRIRTVPNS